MPEHREAQLPDSTISGMEVALSASQNDSRETLRGFNEHRRRLLAIAYRMLGSAGDAEDIVQEAFIRWQQTSKGKIVSPEAFLVTVVSRLCINHLHSARIRREQYFGSWLPEPVSTGYSDDPFSISQMDESLSTAFLVLLERLSPMERAVFLLREVFDYEYSEISGMLEQNEANCRQILGRARRRLKENRPRFKPSAQQHRELLQQFMEASSRGDMDGLLALISNDIVLYADGGGKATAVPNPIYGAHNVVRFLAGAQKKLLPPGLIRRMTHINGQPGIVTYLDGRPFGALTVKVLDGRIRNIYIVSNPDKLTGLRQFRL
jgi:RNA polymerase sigma-70 factor (ECF subfamily)